ncbi:MAG: peptidoglycan-binding domain-containing protein [Pseudomonadota bacterium]
MKVFQWLAVFVLALAASPAMAQRWVSEFGQGVTEASIAVDGTELRVVCAINALIAKNEIGLTLNGAPAQGPVTFQTGRRAPLVLPFDQGSYMADDEVTLTPMLALIEGLRRSNSATATDALGQQVRIPLNGSSAALSTCPVAVIDVFNLGVSAPPPQETETAPPIPEPEPAPDIAAPEPEPETAAPEPEPEIASPLPEPEPEPEPVIPENPIIVVEQSLAKLGYFPGAMDGEIDQALHVAIASWQRDTGREVTGALLVDDFLALRAQAEQN